MYQSPYGFTIQNQPNSVWSPEEEKEVFEKILESLHKGYYYTEVKKNILSNVKGHETHFKSLWDAACLKYKEDMDMDAVNEWKQNKERLLNLYKKCTDANDRKTAVACLKEMNHMKEYEELAQKGKLGKDEDKFTINFNI